MFVNIEKKTESPLPIMARGFRFGVLCYVTKKEGVISEKLIVEIVIEPQTRRSTIRYFRYNRNCLRAPARYYSSDSASPREMRVAVRVCVSEELLSLPVL